MLNAAFLEGIETLQNKNVAFCVVTIVDGRGSIPQIIGAKAIFTDEGLFLGTVGGGKIEARCLAKAVELLRHDRTVDTHFQRWNLQKHVGMTCGGEVALFFEVHRPELVWNIVIFGAGHVSQKLCRFLVELDCHVTCVDTRAEWLEKLPRSDRLRTYHVDDYRDGVDRITRESFVILMTMGHNSDVPVLLAIEKSNLRPPYIGVIGSESKCRILERELRAAGASSEYTDRIICPIGDKVGNNTPPEIAVGVVSQLLRLRRSASGEKIASRHSAGDRNGHGRRSAVGNGSGCADVADESVAPDTPAHGSGRACDSSLMSDAWKGRWAAPDGGGERS